MEVGLEDSCLSLCFCTGGIRHPQEVKSGGVGLESGSMSNLPLATATSKLVDSMTVTNDNIGATVYISGVQSGILRFFGKTKFKPGVWCGIELPQPQGNHDGMVDGVRYFKAKKNCGIFAPVGKVSLKPDQARDEVGRRWSAGGSDEDEHIVPNQNNPTKGSKRPKPASDNSDASSTTVPKKVCSNSLTERKKRRKLEEAPVMNWAGGHNPVLQKSGNSSSGSINNQIVRVPNFAEIEINELNLMEEMERCVGARPNHSSTPLVRNRYQEEDDQCDKQQPSNSSTYDVFPLQVHQKEDINRTSEIPTPPGCVSNKVMIIPEKTTENEKTFTIYPERRGTRANRPTSLDMRLERGGSEEEGPHSEESSSDMGGLFGQKTPELWDGMSLTGLSSPEEAGIQEESSFGLQTPSQLFESWGELKDEELELYQHLRSPSIDNPDFEEEEEEDTHNADEEEDPNVTIVHGSIGEVYKKNTSPPSAPLINTPPLPPITIHESIPDHPERCGSSVISVSGYEPQTDSDFATESEADHEELLLSHPTHTAPNKNRNARVIDGALYNTATSTSTTSSQPSSTSRVTSSATSEEPESSSSGFYSSSESGSLTRGGSRHPSKSASNSDCDSSSGSHASNEADHDEESTLLNSTTTEDASSTITTERNSPEEGVPHLDSLDSTLISKSSSPVTTTKTKQSSCLDDSILGMVGKSAQQLMGESCMLRSQSVSCLSTSSTISFPTKFLLPADIINGNMKPLTHGIVTRKEKVSAAPLSTTATKNLRVKGKHSSVLADTVASSSRRAAAATPLSLKDVGLGVGGRLLSGSSRSLASSTSNLSSNLSTRTPGTASRKVTNKWDSVMAKINEGKGKQINVKEVRAKVFDRILPTSNIKNSANGSIKGSTGNLVGRRRSGLRSENKDAENEPIVPLGPTTKSGGNASDLVKGGGGGNKRGGQPLLQRTDSTSSDCSEHQHHGSERKQFALTKPVKSRLKKDGPRRQISDVSTASECSASQPHPLKSRVGAAVITTSAPSQEHEGQGHSNPGTSNTKTVTKSSKTNIRSTTSTAGLVAPAQIKSPARVSPAIVESKVKSKKTAGSRTSTKVVSDNIPGLQPSSVSSNNKGSGLPPTGAINSTKSTPSGQINNNAKNLKSSQSQESTLVKPLRDHNRISTSASHPPPVSKSKEVITRTRSRRDEKDHTDATSPTLREQLSRLKQEVERLQGDDAVKDSQLEKLSVFANQSEEERVRLVQELSACSQKLEAMAIVVQNTTDKSDIISKVNEDRNQRIGQIEALLRVAEEETKQIPVLKQKLDANEATYQKEISRLKRTYKKDADKVNSEQEGKLLELKSSYEEKLAEQEKVHSQELDRLKETHRLEMESYREIHVNMSPHEVLIKDVASMSAVIEMNNIKMKEMQINVQILTMKAEELIKCENLVKTLSARVEDLEAQLNLSKDDKLSLLAKLTEAELSLADAVGKNKSLSQNVDELSFKLNNPDIVPPSPSASNFKEASSSSTIASLSLSSVSESPHK